MSYFNIAELADELDELIDRRDDEDQNDPLDEIDAERISTLEGLQSELGEDLRICSNHGWDFIPERDFKDYAYQLAEDLGTIDLDASWPSNCIDWTEAARQLAMDYSSVTIDGVDYYYREG